VFWAYICVVVLPVYFFKVEITYIQQIVVWNLELAQGDIDEL
jgi:hypothetical protein